MKKDEFERSFCQTIINLPDRKIRRKKSTISIEEIPNEDTTPKFERLSDNEEAVLITVNELPDEYKDMLALVPDNKDEEDDGILEGDLLTAYLQEEPVKATFESNEKDPRLKTPKSQLGLRYLSLRVLHMKQKQMRRNLLRI